MRKKRVAKRIVTLLTAAAIGVGAFAGLPTTTKAADNAGIRSFVTRMYEVCLDREPDTDGLNDWSNRLATGQAQGADIAFGFIFSEEFKNLNLCNEHYVDSMYSAFFGREADAAGKADWVGQLNSGATRGHVMTGFVNSQEFANVCSQYSVIQGTVTLGSYRDQNEGVTSFVNRLYVKLLDRQGEDEGIENWCRTILTKADTTENVAHGFVFSQEFLNKNTSNEEFVKIMYRTFLDREYDQAGLNDWVGQLNSGVGREQVFHGFAGSTEFHNLMAEYGVD